MASNDVMGQFSYKNIFYEKCLVAHFHLTSIPPLSTWTNNVVKKIHAPLHSPFYLPHYWFT
jgi:hypothetical protein